MVFFSVFFFSQEFGSSFVRRVLFHWTLMDSLLSFQVVDGRRKEAGKRDAPVTCRESHCQASQTMPQPHAAAESKDRQESHHVRHRRSFRHASRS
jgi:hypothetical protein